MRIEYWLYRHLMCAALGFSLLFTGSIAGADFPREVVYSSDGTGRLQDIAIALDSLNQPHLLFTESLSNGPVPKRLVYAKREGGQWVTQTVSTGPLYNGTNGLTIDASGKPHIAVVDVETRNVQYGVLEGGAWRFETVALAANFTEPAIQLNAQDSPMIAYSSIDASRTFGRGELATRSASGVWSDTASLVPTSLVYDSGPMNLELDQDGTPYITYTGWSTFASPPSITLVKPDPVFGGALTATTVIQATRNDFTYTNADLEITADNKLRIASSSIGTFGLATHHVLTGSGWEETVLNNRNAVFTNPVALALDSQGRSHILHTAIHAGIGSSSLKLLTVTSTGTDETLLESHTTGGGSAWLTGMQIDGADNTHIVFSSDQNRGVTYLFIPEPASLCLLGLGGLTLLRHRSA